MIRESLAKEMMPYREPSRMECYLRRLFFTSLRRMILWGCYEPFKMMSLCGISYLTSNSSRHPPGHFFSCMPKRPPLPPSICFPLLSEGRRCYSLIMVTEAVAWICSLDGLLGLLPWGLYTHQVITCYRELIAVVWCLLKSTLQIMYK